VTAAEPRSIQPARAGLDVVVRVPGSKSVTNRALLFAALADGESTLDGALVADDTLAFADGLRSLGFEVAWEAAGGDDAGGNAAGRLRVRGATGRIPATEASVWCADAGTAARFLLAACAAGHGRYAFDASAQLRRRPMGLLLEALRAQGAAVEPAGADALPVTVIADGLAGGDVVLPGDVSSQFVSALLLAAPLARSSLDIRVERLVSRPYVDMTLAMMAQFGVDTEREDHTSFRVRPSTYRARNYAVEPDASTASYFFAAAALAPGRVTVPGLRRRGGLQGDVRFLDVLEAMGCQVSDGAEETTVQGPARALAGLTVDMADIPDTFMTLAAIAPFASSPVTMTGIANVRLKESDRIAAMEEGLRRVGIRTESGPDHLRVFPGPVHGATIDPHGDHRIAMSFAVLGLRAPGVVIDDPACVRKTCPGFFELWAQVEDTDRAARGGA
jgi:3-phosphoshikimate 1-carboxyvinyltransferase